MFSQGLSQLALYSANGQIILPSTLAIDEHPLQDITWPLQPHLAACMKVTAQDAAHCCKVGSKRGSCRKRWGFLAICLVKAGLPHIEDRHHTLPECGRCISAPCEPGMPGNACIGHKPGLPPPGKAWFGPGSGMCMPPGAAATPGPAPPIRADNPCRRSAPAGDLSVRNLAQRYVTTWTRVCDSAAFNPLRQAPFFHSHRTHHDGLQRGRAEHVWSA